jgi:predicted ABC-type transport system involved in lysophospholipase L1 biosynthesis ATPase subunit
MGERGLHVRLRQAGPIPLDAELSCGEGQLLALIGPSGSGKTTILRAIAGLYLPREGRVTCGGEVWFDAAEGINIAPHKRPVGLVFQSYALFPHMTALRNVMAALGHRSARERKAEARALLALVHLQNFEDRRPASLSGGEQQRVAVARALAREPAVLFPAGSDGVMRERGLHVRLRQAGPIPLDAELSCGSPSSPSGDSGQAPRVQLWSTAHRHLSCRLCWRKRPALGNKSSSCR